MLEHDRQVIHSSALSNWKSPTRLFEVLHDEFFFCLDAAADAASALCADYIGPDRGESGLTVNWAERVGVSRGIQRPIYLNPPYSVKQWRASVKAGAPDEAMLIEKWAEKCYLESRRGCTIVGVFPYSPQTDWYRQFVMGHHDIPKGRLGSTWKGHAAMQERRLSHRVKFLHPDGTPAGSAGVNTVVIVWTPAIGMVGPWQPHSFYWSYRKAKAAVAVAALAEAA